METGEGKCEKRLGGQPTQGSAGPMKNVLFSPSEHGHPLIGLSRKNIIFLLQKAHWLQRTKARGREVRVPSLHILLVLHVLLVLLI